METIIKYINNSKWDEAIKKISDINDKIIDGNSIFHIACIRGNSDVINKLINKVDVYSANSRGETCLHLLFRNGWDKLGEQMYNKYNDLLETIDAIGRTPIFWTIDRPETLNKVVDDIIKLNITHIFNKVTFDSRTLAMEIIDRLKDKKSVYYELLNKLLKHIDTTKPKAVPLLHYSIIKKNNLALELILESGADPEFMDNKFIKPINIACSVYDVPSVELLLKHNVDISYGGTENDYLPVNIAINNNFYDLLKLLVDHIDDYTVIDRYQNLYVHYIVYALLNGIEIEDEIVIKFLENSNLNKKNVSGISSIQLLKQLEKKKNKKYNVSNIINTDTATNSESLSPIDPKLSDYRSFGLFNSDIIHNAIYTTDMLTKYGDLTCPTEIVTDSEKENEYKMLELQNIPFDRYYISMFDIVDVYYKYFRILTPHLIVWRDRYTHYIHPKFKENLKKCIDSEKRFILIKISLVSSLQSTHANVVLIDKVAQNIRRFEPYGITNILDSYYLDTIIGKTVSSLTNKKYKYYRPCDYLSDARFQTISNDANPDTKKLGDPNGYCLAWCFWYVELKLNNIDVDEKELIELALADIQKKYESADNPYLAFIRQYAKTLDLRKNDVLKSCEIDESHYYDTSYTKNNINKISKCLETKIKKLI